MMNETIYRKIISFFTDINKRSTNENFSGQYARHARICDNFYHIDHRFSYIFKRCKIIIFLLFLMKDVLFVQFRLQLGYLVYFSLEYWATVISYRHTMGIKAIYGDADGTKIAFVDDHNQGYIYNPVTYYLF